MKRILSIVLALLLIASVALAASKLQINSGQKLEAQFQAFRDYLGDLNKKDRDAWLEELSSISLYGLSEGYSISQDDPIEKMVWIPRTGSKYHKKVSCSNMKNPTEVTLSMAISLGYERCSKCKP